MANLKHILYLLLFCKAVYASYTFRRRAKELLTLVSDSTNVALPPNITKVNISIPLTDIKKIKALLIRLKPLERALERQNTTYVITKEEQKDVKELFDSILKLAKETSILSVIQKLSTSSELQEVADATGRRLGGCIFLIFCLIKRLFSCALNLIGMLCGTICGCRSRGGNGYGNGYGYGMPNYYAPNSYYG